MRLSPLVAHTFVAPAISSRKKKSVIFWHFPVALFIKYLADHARDLSTARKIGISTIHSDSPPVTVKNKQWRGSRSFNVNLILAGVCERIIERALLPSVKYHRIRAMSLFRSVEILYETHVYTHTHIHKRRINRGSRSTWILYFSRWEMKSQRSLGVRHPRPVKKMTPCRMRVDARAA